MTSEHRAWLRAAVVATSCIGAVFLGQSTAGPFEEHDGVTDRPESALVRALTRFDAGWYAGIASDGYWYKEHSQAPVAYFPAYPLAIRAVMTLGVNRWLAGIMVSLLAGLAAVAVFRAWARRVGGEEVGERAFIWLLAYPFTFYLFGVMYSDSLFLLLACSAFLFVEKDRPVLATLFGVLATACRPVAPAIVLGLLWRQLEKRANDEKPFRAVDFLPALAGLGLAAYMLHLHLRVGDALAFAHVHSAPGWDQPPGLRTWLKYAWFETLFPRVAPTVAFRLVGHAALTLFALAMIRPMWRRLPRGYTVYCAVAIGLPALSSKDFMGLGRYIIAAFPLFLLMPMLLKERPRLERAVLVGSASLMLLFAIAFGTGAYVS